MKAGKESAKVRVEKFGTAQPPKAPEQRSNDTEHTLTHVANESIRLLPVPVIARINGWCLGFGMELAAACDMRIGTDTSKFGMPEVRVGIPSGMEANLLPAASLR